ncbi:EAL domain-containing protein [Aliivibrio kagoshimensis]|uniref:EAL domain-containing protein n=1 Tax=Aliivibrio kagoshimensis TaxID=2910230 RepID=UPI003D0A3D2D
MTIIRQILAAFLLVTFTLGGAGYIGISHIQDELTTHISADSIKQASTLIENIDENIYNRIKQLQVYSEIFALTEHVERSNAFFKRLQNHSQYIHAIGMKWQNGSHSPVINEILTNPASKEIQAFVNTMNSGYGSQLLSEMFVTNKYGVVTATSGRTSNYLQSDQAWYQQALKEESFFVGDVVYDASLSTYASSVAIKLYDSKGEYIGILNTILNIIDPIRIIKESEEADQHTSRQTKLITRSNHMIYSTEHESPLTIATTTILNLLDSQQLNSGFTSAPGDMPGEGDEIFAISVSRGYRDYKGIGWSIIIEHNKDEVLSSVNILKKEVIGTLTVVMIMAAIWCVYISHSISRPLVKLSKAVSLFGVGKWDTPVEISSNNEVGALSKTFNNMVKELRGSTVSKTYFDNIVNSTPNSLIVVIPNGDIELVNRATTTLFGYTEQELMGRSVRSLFAPTRKDDPWKLRGIDIIARLQQKNVEDIFLTKQGLRVPVCVSGSPMFNAKGELQAVVIAVLDIRATKQAEQQLERLAHYDSLTQLPNRTLFMHRIQHALDHAQKHSEQVALLFLDLDRFKNINDSLGHAVGDQLLQTVAKRLKLCTRKGDTIARLAGDEFTIILQGDNDAESASIVAQNILKAFQEPFLLNNMKPHVSMSIGISLFPHDGSDTQTLLKSADAAMYHAKDQGRNNYQFFTPKLTEAVTERFVIENQLREAIERDEFELYYQPQVSLADNQIIGVEALIRWHHPERGLLAPDSFFAIAEDSGLICAIGKQVLRKACFQAKEWVNNELPPIVMAVNIAGQQIIHKSIKEHVESILVESQLDPHYLELEVTEGFFIGTNEQVINTLKELKSLGLTLAIDDFGTGYSSLSYLKRLPVDKLKIDRSFVQDLDWGNRDESFVQAIIAMGNSLHLQVIAEGVETENQKALLMESGCAEYQGYLFSKPVAAAQMTILLENQLFAENYEESLFINSLRGNLHR